MPRPAPVAATDERRHEPADDPLWNESWYFDFTSADGALGGYVRLGLHPNLATVWYWACVVGDGRPLVSVVDHEVALPATGSLEIRSEGLWADHTCETPLDHWSLGLEAFATALDDPADAYASGTPGGARGERTPLGLDLEWETAGEPYPYPGIDRYEVPCTVHGEILVGDERMDFDGHGQRDHSWGTRDWWTFGWCWTAGRLDDGTTFHATQVRAPGAGLVEIDGFSVEEDLGIAGLPLAAHMVIGEMALDVTPRHLSPVLLVAPDGRVSRLPRALCRFTERDGARTGHGWTEWNQPEPPPPVWPA